MNSPAATFFQPLLDAFATLVFPQMCDLCGEQVDSLADGVTCRTCWLKVPDLDATPRCQRCYYPLAASVASSLSGACRRCQAMELDLLRFVGPYEGAFRSNLLFLKTRDHVCRRMREMIADRLRGEAPLLSADRLIPVPLHPRRLRERGYNQAEVIARLIASAFDHRLDCRSLVRVKHTDPHRAGMDSAARTKSVSNAFAVIEPEKLSGQTILLVDDIYTTGATLDECARVLSEAGASAVYAFTVARTV